MAEQTETIKLIQVLVESYNYVDKEVYTSTKKKLLELGETAAPALIECLRVVYLSNPAICADVSEILIQIGKPAVPHLISAIQRHRLHDLSEVSAVRILGKIKDQRAVEPLIRIISNISENPSFLEEALKTLGILGNTTAIPHLVALLVKLKSPISVSTDIAYSLLATDILDSIKSFGDSAITILLDLLGKEDEQTRESALYVLVYFSTDLDEIEKLRTAVIRRVNELKDSPFYERLKEQAIAALIKINQNDQWLLATPGLLLDSDKLPKPIFYSNGAKGSNSYSAQRRLAFSK